jgi:hypothetical protein
MRRSLLFAICLAFALGSALSCQPTSDSVSPTAGTGATQTFTFVSSSASGAGSIAEIFTLFNYDLDGGGACFLIYYPGINTIALANDTASAWTTQTLPATGTLQNSQCSLNLATVAAVSIGNSIQLTVGLTFLAGLPGPQNVYSITFDSANATSGWRQLGVWNPDGTSVPARPSGFSATPASGGGARQSFTYRASSSRGYTYLTQIHAMFDTAVNGLGDCWVYYNRLENAFLLMNDTATGWIYPDAGNAGVLSNSQCTLDTNASGASGSGNELAVSFALSFSTTFAGDKHQWMLVQDRAPAPTSPASTWTSVGGVWTVPSLRVTPDSTAGSGLHTTQTFTFQASPVAGQGSLQILYALINYDIDGGGACFLIYYPGSNSIALANDTASAWSMQALPNSGTLENSQCRANLASSSGQVVGSSVVFSVNLTFKAGLPGPQNVYSITYDAAGVYSGWQKVGTWNADGSAVPARPSGFSVTPANGAGLSQTFTYRASSPGGYTYLTQMHAMIDTSVNGVGACWVYYNRLENAFLLMNDTATGWIYPGTGNGGVLSNSQCTLNTNASSASGSGNELAVNFALSFASTWGGQKTQYLLVQDRAPSPASPPSVWTQVGTWGVPGPYTISGQATLNGAGLSGVTVSLSGSQTATTTTNASGNYTFTGVWAGSYTVTPSKSGSTFVPSSPSANITSNWSVPVFAAVAPAITTSALAAGTVGVGYSQAVAASGGSTPYTWSATGLPPGLAINSSTGSITGTPATAATYSATFQVAGSDSALSTRQLNMTISAPASLTITSTHTGNFTQADTGDTYTLTVSNTGTGSTNGATVTVTESIPPGIVPTAINGSGWTCTQPAGPCYRTDLLAPNSSYSAITLTTSVSPNAPATTTNAATVSGGGSASSSASDPTTIVALPRYANPLAFAVPASVIGGAATTFSVQYTSDNGPSDIDGGTIKIDGCYFDWDSTGNMTLYGNSIVSGRIGPNGGVLYAGSCSINLAGSSLTTPASNPKALVLALNIAFPEQDFTSDFNNPIDFTGSHEVYAWGNSHWGLSTGQIDLGAVVVSQGQDFILNITPGGGNSIPVPSGLTTSLNIAAVGLNGFGATVNITEITTHNPCFSVTHPSLLTPNTQGNIVVWNINCPNGTTVQFTLVGEVNSGTPNHLYRRASASPTFVAGPNGDFTITVGQPSSPTLSATGGLSYPITVNPVNGQSGSVNLEVLNTPTGVTAQFDQTQVSVGSATTLRFTGSANAAGGSFPLTLRATSVDDTTQKRTADFSLGTQVTTLQVTSATNSGIVHNDGQEVQITHAVPANNAPTYTTCDSPDPNVICRVISTSSGTVTLGVTAGTQAAHGSRVFKLNGQAVALHMAVANRGSSSGGLPSFELYPGDFDWATVEIPFEDCAIDEECGFFPTLVSTAGWITGVGDFSSMTLSVSPPSNAAVGHYSYWIDLCSDDWSPDGGSCSLGPGDVDILSPPSCGPVPFVISSTAKGTRYLAHPRCVEGPIVTLSPDSLALSTGDTNKTITVNTNPAMPYTVSFSISRRSPSPPGTYCDASLAIPESSGNGTFNAPVTASAPNCSGDFSVTGSGTENVINVVVPPQALVRQMMGEARGFSEKPSLDPNQVAQRSVGIAAKNRFTLPGFGGYMTWQDMQAAGQIATWNVLDGPLIVIDNAVAVYTGLVGSSFVGGASCYWSPTTTQFQTIHNQYQASPNSTALPSNTGKPNCYTQPGQYAQIVWKISEPDNTLPGFIGAPAFMFIRQRNASDPAIIQIP